MRDVNFNLSEENTQFAAALAELAVRIKAQLEPEMPDYDEFEDPCYFYRDTRTMRDFEIRQFERIDDSGAVRIQFFLHEFVPNGRIGKTNEHGHVTHIWEEPLVAEVEKRLGPNHLISELEKSGIYTPHLIRSGGGRGAGSRYFDSIEACATAIAHALFNNVRYDYLNPLTEQQKARLDFHAAKNVYAYLLEQKKSLETAMSTCEEGMFKGCTDLCGAPLDNDCKKAILAYLNEPLPGTWLQIRRMVVTGTGTLWQAWCAYDRNAPSYGAVGFPPPDTLITALRKAIERRAQEIDEELAVSSPTGLRLVA
jgi:hypothetical protein